MIKIYAPASIGNISVGFDVLGLALSPINQSFLGDIIIIEKSKSFNLINDGIFSNKLPINIEENIVFHCWKKFCKILRKKIPLKITLKKNMPIGSGLGSSACSIVSTIVGLNNFCGKPLNKLELLSLMGILEGKISGSIHYDNVAPCFLGGVQLIINKQNNISQSIPFFKDWFWVISYPGINISTSQSRSILPKKYSQETCIKHSRNLASFIHASHSNQSELAAMLMKDHIAEPYRKKLIPDFIKAKKATKKIGAISFGISGSGPTVFAICNKKNIGLELNNWFNENFIKNKSGFTLICKVDEIGARQIG